MSCSRTIIAIHGRVFEMLYIWERLALVVPLYQELKALEGVAQVEIFSAFPALLFFPLVALIF